MMLCIGVRDLFKGLLLDALQRLETAQQPAEPFSLHVPLLGAIVGMHDVSVWSMRDVVRGIEKVKTIDSINTHVNSQTQLCSNTDTDVDTDTDTD